MLAKLACPNYPPTLSLGREARQFCSDSIFEELCMPDLSQTMTDDLACPDC